MRALFSCFSSFRGKLIWKTSPVVFGEIVGVFLNTLTSDGKYPVQGCENFQLAFHTQLSEKRKPFADVFVPFLDSTSNVEHFERKAARHS